MSREQAVSDAFVELADTLHGQFDLDAYLHLLARHCGTLFDAASTRVLLADEHGELANVATVAPAGPVDLGDPSTGPGADAHRSGQPVSCVDLARPDLPWPGLSGAAEAGLRSVHAWPLRYRNQVIGATEVYQATPGPFPDADARLAESLATIVAISVLRERRQERADTLAGQLQQALNSRLVIEQAKGILAERVRVGVDQAFTMLRAHARRHQMRLALLAQQVVEGTLDTTLLASEPAPSSRRRTATPAALRRTARQETRRAAHDPA